MEQFKISHVLAGDTLKIVLVGKLNEFSKLDNIPDFAKAKTAEIDFDKLTFINSVGISRWLQWVQGLAQKNPTTIFHYVKCPKVIIDQVNGIRGFLPENGSIDSLFVPYYSESTNKLKNILIVRGQHYDRDKAAGSYWVRLPQFKGDAENPAEDFEPDIITDKYFHFLKR